MDRVDTVESSTARSPGYDRDPPFSPEAEVSVLGGMLIDTDAVDRAAEVVNDSMFFREAHRRIFRSMLRLFERGDVIDVITVSEELKKTGELEQAGGLDYLAELLDAVPTAANIEYHARIVREKALLRRLIDAASTIIRDVYEPGNQVVEEVLDQAEQRIFQVAQSHAREGFVWIKEILWPTFEHIERLQESSTGITGVPTGFSDLDRMTTGLQKGDLCIVAARPAMGKTSWVLNVAQNAAIEHEIPVAIFSLEMSKQQLVQRFLCAEGRVDAQKLRRGKLSPEEYQRLAAAAGHLNTAPLWIDDSPGSTVLEMRAKARRLKAETDLGMLVIDYMQLMASDRRSESRVQEVSEISRGLKALARELDVPVVALSQLSRAPEQRTDRRPQLSDLRESGCLTGDTLVDLADGGRERISDLVGREGVRVWALDEETWELVPSEVARAFCTGRKPVYRMTTRSGRSLRATANHQFRTLEGWRRLDELGAGDRIATPRRIQAPDRRRLEDAEAALLGHLIGDGCTLPGRAIQYTTREPELAEAVAELAKTVFSDGIRTRLSPERTWYQLFLSSARPTGRGRLNPIRRWMEELGAWGLRSHEKRAPEILFGESAHVVAVFLRHLWATDGCIHVGSRGYPAVYYASSSERLARDVQALMLRLGVLTTLRRVPQDRRGRDQYHVIVSGRADLLRFAVTVGAFGARRTAALRDAAEAVRERRHNTNHDIVPAALWSLIVRPLLVDRGISHRELYRRVETPYAGMTLLRQNLGRRRAARVARAVGSSVLERLAFSDVLWDEVVSVEPAGTEPVYDLTVPGPHNFVADGIVAHNSIEQDADLVMFLYRPEYYFGPVDKDGNSIEGQSELIVGKQRNGPTGIVNLYFHKAYTRFDSVTRSDRGEPAPQGDGSGAPFGGA